MAVESRTKVRARRVRVLPPDRARTARPVDRLVLEGRDIKMALGGRLLGATLERIIANAPNTLTLSLWNGDRAMFRTLLGQRVLTREARVELDGLGYIATGFSKQGNTVSVPFEDECITILKLDGKDKPLHVGRDTMTRAGFCAGMIRAAGVAVIVLDEDVIQPIAGQKKLKAELAKAKRKAAKENSRRTRSSRGDARGVTGSGLTINTETPTAEQRRNVATTVARGAKDKANELATLAALVAGIAEGQFVTARVNASGRSDAKGPFQVLSSTARALGISPTDVDACAHVFFTRGFASAGGAIELARQHPDWSPAMIASYVELGSAGVATYYGKFTDEAKQWLRAGRGQDLTDATGTDSAAYIKDETFARHKGESTWKACVRLLSEVKWVIFAREGVIVIASETALMRGQASLTLAEYQDGTQEVDFDGNRGLRVGELTAKVDAGRYDLDPGEPCDVEGLPPVHARWLISSVSQDLLSPHTPADIAAKRPQQPADEPASTLVTKSGTAAAGSVSDADNPVREACKQISAKHYPYVWGGGHARAGTPDRGDGSDPGIGYDCSGSVVAALAMVGYGFRTGGGTATSGTLETWGAAGQGKDFTVYANGGHTFIQGDGWRFDTGGPGGGHGPQYHLTTRDTGGFVARRWTG